MYRFEQWALENGVEISELEPIYKPTSGWGLYSKREIPAGKILLKVNECLIIRASLLKSQQPYAQILRRFPNTLMPFDLLVVFFAHEKSLGDASNYMAYINILPEYMMTPIANIDFPIDVLPRSGQIYLEKQRIDFNNCKKRVTNVWCEFNGTSMTDTLFNWAWYMVNSRCLYTENEECSLLDNSNGDNLSIIPFFDLLNHAPMTRTLPEYNKKKKCFILTSDDSYCAGKEVFITYGAHDNVRLLLEYGFTLPQDDQYGKISLLVDDLKHLCEMAKLHWCDEHERYLQLADLRPTVWCSQLAPSWAVLAACTLLNMPDEQLSTKWRSINDVLDYEDNSDALLTCKKLLEALMTWMQELRETARDRIEIYEKETSSKISGDYNMCTIMMIWDSNIDIIQQSINQTDELIACLDDK